jgi:hypothetical protein
MMDLLSHKFRGSGGYSSGILAVDGSGVCGGVGVEMEPHISGKIVTSRWKSAAVSSCLHLLLQRFDPAVEGTRF